MEDVFVGSLMSAPVHTVDGGTALRAAAGLLIEHDVGSVVVVEQGRLDGILTVTDVVRIVAGEASYGPETPVSDVMSTDVVTVAAADSVEAAADRMVETGHYHLPVVDGGAPIGIVTATDLAAYVSTVRAPNPPRRG
ncbi:CBS domain-containing protein [Haloplanus rallus]|jgi:CBS domain-containing protein|uniref:CBS domain-containing protein n=1 Tax=Haloplanus rallus TaxID=1816183 RepID=A0A6B9F956_9EURY|nr:MULTISPECIES: CBS domain-containing protein [Haloplanus]QGX95037.1 CBS domain-containing protein [Haloplanus rallus]